MNLELHELVSAYVDGEATAEEVIAVESNPEAMELVAQFRELAMLNAAVPIDPAEQSRIINQVLALHTGDAPDQLADVTVPPRLSVVDTAPATDDGQEYDGVIDLAARRRRRPGTWIMSAAAGLFMVVGGTMLVGQMRSQTDDAGTEGAALTTTMMAAESDAAEMPMAAEQEDRAHAAATNEMSPSDADEGGGREDAESAGATDSSTADGTAVEPDGTSPATSDFTARNYEIILDASLGPDEGDAALDAAVELGFPVLHQAILNQSNEFMTCTLPTAPLSWVAVDVDGVEHWLVVAEPLGYDPSNDSAVDVEPVQYLLAPDCTPINHMRMAD